MLGPSPVVQRGLSYCTSERAPPKSLAGLAARVVVVMTGPRVDSPHCANHLGGEQDVVHLDHSSTLRVAGAGPMPMMRGGTPAHAIPTTRHMASSRLQRC